MTKKQAERKAWLYAKQLVKLRFTWDEYTDEAIKLYGLKLLKKEISHAKKEVTILWDSISKDWVAVHQESGLIN